mgnify:FL=1
MTTTHPLSPELRNELLQGRMAEPHSVLGMHPLTYRKKPGVAVRALVRGAETCQVVLLKEDGSERKRVPLRRKDDTDFFEVFTGEVTKVTPYRLRVTFPSGEVRQFYDPYAFLPTLSDHDLYLFNEGNEHFIYRKLGAHPHTVREVPGVAFAVWAPNARRVSLVCDAVGWDGRYLPLRRLGSSGVWELFVPGLKAGLVYKYEILGADGNLHLKSDPYATRFEPPPHNASIVCPVDDFAWSDQEWMEERARQQPYERPISIYEVHAGSWMRDTGDGHRSLNYRELAPRLADYAKEHGFTHVEFLPLAEHPFAGSWGYQVTGFFAPTHRFGTPEDFQAMVDHLHREGVGVIVDWVPGHFPKDSFALSWFDGTHLFEHADPRKGEHRDWGTLIFNYGRHEVRCFLIASVLAWMDRFHVDGFRVDAVASMLYLDYSREEGDWIPNEYGGRENLEAIDFLRSVNDLLHYYYPGAVMIAEESTSFGSVSWPSAQGGLGFDFKWNMGWMHDTLRYFSEDPLYRKYHQDELTFGMLYQNSEHFVLAFSHDEVVHGKSSLLMKMGVPSIPAKAANLRALYGWMWGWPGKKTLFMGCEFGQSSEWRYDGQLDWHLLEYLDHRGIRSLVADLNHLYQEDPVLAATDHDPAAFSWVNCSDAEHSVLSFLRRSGAEGEEGSYVVVANLTPVQHDSYRIGVPAGGFWHERINTNAADYGGTGTGNLGGVFSTGQPADDQPDSVLVCLPPMSVLFLRKTSG